MRFAGRSIMPRHGLLFVVATALGMAVWPASCHAQHGNYLLGTLGLLGAVQAPDDRPHYQNVFSYYHASESRTFSGTRTIGTDVQLQGDLTLSGTLDVFVDQNIFVWTTPLKVFGASYGMLIDIPLAHLDASGNASLDFLAGPFDRTFARGTQTGLYGLGDIYVEPINLGWHLPRLDIYAGAGFFAPAGHVDPDRIANIGLGRWAEMLSLGGVAYLDAEKTWSVSVMSRYLRHEKQETADVRVGDDVIVEWGIGKSFRPSLGQIDVGAVGYAQWQVTDASGSDVPSRVKGLRAVIYGAGPEIAMTTKFGRFFFRYEFEFGAKNAAEGQVLLFGAGL
jgi:hypothetical protein